MAPPPTPLPVLPARPRLRPVRRESLARPPLLPSAARPWAWRFALLCFALALLTLPIAWTVRFSAQSGWWWERGFDTYNVERRTALDRAELDRAGADLRAYFLSDAQRANIVVTNRNGDTEPLFSERETAHLVDVKRLLERTYDAGWAAIGVIVAFLAGVWYWRRGRLARSLARAGRLAGAGVVLGTAALAVVAATGFDEAFRQFHLLFFTNDLWQLSSSDRLIQMFPQGFFFETTMLIGGATIALTGVVGLAGWAWIRRHPDRPPAPDDDPLALPGVTTPRGIDMDSS